jgi:hypothetical protein
MQALDGQVVVVVAVVVEAVWLYSVPRQQREGVKA